MSFGRSIAELQAFAAKADVTGNMRITIVFSSDRDRAYFERQLIDELKGGFASADQPGERLSNFRYRGIDIRILS